MVGEIYDNYIAPIQESIERLKKAIQALDKRLSNEILRINSLASSSVSDGKTLTALEEWRKTHEEWTDKQIKDLLEGIDKKLDFDEKIEALEEKTIGITNENYLKRGIELSGVRNIVKEFLEVIKSGNTPSDLAFKQWLEMLEGNNNAYSL